MSIVAVPHYNQPTTPAKSRHLTEQATPELRRWRQARYERTETGLDQQRPPHDGPTVTELEERYAVQLLQ